MQIFDISRTLSHDLPPWPGDVGFRYQVNGRIAEGSSVNVGSISMSLHNGTHADASFHFDDNGWKIEQANLETYFGPAVVVDLSARYAGQPQGGRWSQVQIADLEHAADDLRATGRLLLKTGVWRDPKVFPDSIPTLALGAPAWLQALGVKLLGLDVPSVDEIDAKQLVNHHAIGAAGISIVESLELSAVAAGRYNFVAFPLKIAGGDGSPVRAILWRE
jgi:arylformamidase